MDQLPPVPEELMVPLFGNVGMIVMNWTFVESALDVWSALAFHDHGGSGVEKQLQRQFNRKFKFLRKCFARLPTLMPYADDFVPFMEKANELSEIRRFVAHGTLSAFDAARNESFLFTIVSPTDDYRSHSVEEKWIPGNQLVGAGVTLLLMAIEGHRLSNLLIGLSGEE